jgi:sulfhydrogenase subunit gamma (sulfur reductase)
MASEHGSKALHRARVLSHADAGGGLVLLTLMPETAARHSYVRAGQYVSVQATPDATTAGGYFVLAGDAGAERWELVIRPGSETANAVLSVPDQGQLWTSAARGSGFPFEEARGRPLLLAATGSGIAAMRSIVAHRVRDGEGARTLLLHGVRGRGDVPLPSEIERWRSQGVRVTVCLSREAVRAGESGFVEGYVQDVARRTAADAAHQGGMIFAAGVKPMIDAVRALARDLGVAETDVRTNY